MSAARAVEPQEIVARIVTVTPAQAALMLKCNVKNRNVRRDAVAAYSRDMAAGMWQMTGEPIKFDHHGNLIDGQRRLLAVIAANVPVELMVVRGVRPETQEVMDSGIKRSAMDALSLKGYKNTSYVSAAARLALTESGAGFIEEDEEVRTPTNSEIAEWIAEWDELVQRSADQARVIYKGLAAPPAVITVAWMRLSQIDLAACHEFFFAIVDQRTDGPGDPRLALSRRLTNIKTERVKVKNYVYLSLIFRAWNAWRQDQKIRSLPTHIGNDSVRIPENLR